MEEIRTLLTSINEHLGVLAEAVTNKKKKSDTKKEESEKKEKRNLYLKKKDGTLEINPVLVHALNAEQTLFLNQMIERYPNICRMEDPLTLEQYNKLVMRYTLPNVMDMLGHFDNNRRINNYVSAYKALDNWLMKAERNSR